jgi:DMSO/TMAO reductase YedYZ molybdopterin-dependent catalytic subunit
MRALWPFAIAGAAAAALAIGAGELAAALLGGSSIIAAIGALVIDLQPPGAKDFVVALFGEADKLALEIATATGGLLVGALLGIAASRDIRLAHAGFFTFGVAAFAVLTREPFFEPFSALITVSLAAATGMVVLPYLIGLVLRTPFAASAEEAPAQTAAADPETRALARRGFLLLTTGALAVGGLLTAAGRYLTAQLPTIETAIPVPRPAQTLPPPPPAASLDVPGRTPNMVPNDDFYRIDTRLTIPRLDADDWTVRIHGMVEREVELTYRQLTQLPMVERYVTIACVSNEVGGYLVGNAKWGGVLLNDVLELAGERADASQLVGRSFDGWTAGFPTAHLRGTGSDSLVALLMNDEILPPKHGFPVRLIVPGLYGYVSATKWLTELELTTLDAYDPYWVRSPRDWAKEAPILTQSRIEVPRRGAQLPAGSTTIAGVAWAPTREISKVEVQVNEEPWREAALSQPLSGAAWVQWQVGWELAAGRTLIRARATDGTGALQDTGPTPPFPDGARGWHEIQVNVG